MRRLILASLTLIAFAFGVAEGGSAHAQTIGVEPVVWTFGHDYPGANPSDVDLPVTSVYIKTHDGDDYMSRWDTHPSAISGPNDIRELIAKYGAQGIDVYAWFVPVGLNVERQLQLALEVIDSGVKGLYADLEPFEGFCFQDCWYLAEHFWQPLRQLRPNAQLGVIYDPRTWWLEPSATAAWLQSADVALPMCYWESYAGQGIFGDPAGCVNQGYVDLAWLAPGRNLEYVPMLQGDTSPERFVAAMDAALGLGSSRVSVWRRGVVSADTWNAAANYAGPIMRPCWAYLEDGCYFREWSSPTVYVIQSGARFTAGDVGSLGDMEVRVAPDGVASRIPTMPREDSLLKEANRDEIYVVRGGARFWVPSPEIFEGMGFDWNAVRTVPRGALDSIPLVPPDYTRVTEYLRGGDFVIIDGQKLPVDDARRSQLARLGKGMTLYVAPPGWLDTVPAVVSTAGDASCNSAVDTVDALQVLQNSGGISHLGLCIPDEGDVDCDGDVDTVDALWTLRYVAALPNETRDGCRPIGQ
jgi:hypothetical protein